MIYSVTVEGYQAIQKATIDLGSFTVVTGATGSGKSSLIRAIKLAAFNARGKSYIRHGETICQVILGVDDGVSGSVGIQRGARGQDSYGIKLGEDEQLYTKLAGKVPDDVVRLLRISELNFAEQFDRPYLLTDSGGEVARTLGALTNVTVLFSAAREANRRRLEAARQQRDVQARLEATRADAQRFRGMPQRRTAVAEAEVHLKAAQDMQRQLDRLAILASRLQAATAQLSVHKPAVTVPDLDAAHDLHQRSSRIRSLLAQASSSASIRTAAMARAREAMEAVTAAEKQYAETLRQAGRCPTCGQAIHS